jgi:hypothetical protein
MYGDRRVADGDAAQRARAALSARPDDRIVGIDADRVEFFEAMEF